MILSGVLTFAGNIEAITPQQGTLNLQISYNNGVTGLGPAFNATTTVSYADGVHAASSQTGATPSFTLNYGSYLVSIAPEFVMIGGNFYVASGYSKQLSIPVTPNTVSVNDFVLPTHSSTVTLSGFQSGSTAYVSLQTPSGFTYQTYKVTTGTFTANLTSSVYVNVNYSSAVYSYYYSSTGSTLTVPVTSTHNIYGFVDSANGQRINTVTVSLINTTATPYNYTQETFSGDYFSIYSQTFSSKTVIISSPGYKSDIVVPPASGGQISSITLAPASSNVYYNYTLSSDLQTLYANVTYVIGDSTAIPYFSNSSIGSLYWQISIDSLTSSNISSYLGAILPTYTNTTFLTNGFNYNRTTLSVKVASLTTTSPASLLAYVNATYVNSAIPASLYSSGLSLSVYDLGQAKTPGNLNYTYSVAYKNTSIGLSSSSVGAVTFKSPIIISPVTSPQMVSLKFSKVSSPTFQDPLTTFYWKNLNSTNYVLNSSLNNTAFIAPVNLPVSINISRAYFNPVTGSNDYQNAYFLWKVNGTTVLSGFGKYNLTYTFLKAANYEIYINSTSPSGGQNSTTFNVSAFNGVPSLNFTILYSGKKISNQTSSSTYAITIPQSTTIRFSVYNTSLTVPSTNYKVPLLYKWKFNDSVATSVNVTHIFTVPTIKTGLQYVNISVQGVTGAYRNLTFKVNVTDTTPPVARITMTNATGSSVANPTANSTVVFWANYSKSPSYDPYYSNAQLKYSWKVMFASNGTVVSAGPTTYNITSGSLNSSAIGIKFLTLENMRVSLNVTNPITNLSGHKEVNLTIIVNTPRIEIVSATVQGTPTEGSPVTISLTVTNVGTKNAYAYNVSILINNQLQGGPYQLYYLNVSQQKQVNISWTPSLSGSSITLVIQGSTHNEPAFFSTLGSTTLTTSIKAPSYTTPLVIGAIVAIVVVVAVAYWYVSTRGIGTRKKEEGTEKKSLLEQKKLEKKK